MIISYTKNAASDIEFWRKTDIKVYLRIKKIIDNIYTSPFKGIGKPESLRYSLSGKWSRRITKEHRLIYEVTEDRIIIYACKYHY